MCFLGPRKSQVPREAKGDKLVPGTRAPEAGSPWAGLRGRTQPQLQLVSVAWTGHTSPGSLAPDVRQAEGGRRLERPPHPQPLLTGAENTSATGRRPANRPVLRVSGTGWEETPAPPCPGGRRRPCPGEGDRGPGVRTLQGCQAELGAGEGARRLRRSPLSPGTRASTPQAGPEERDPVPQTSLHGYKPTAAQGWARSPASERDPSKMPAGTAPDSKGGAGTR